MDTVSPLTPATAPAAPRITPVTFANAQGQVLFGMLHEPQRPVPGVVVLLLSPGVKMRVAPHRMYNKMADRFVRLGYTVFRFDFHGLGDSEGEAPEPMLADLYCATQTGRYVSDTICAMDWMQRHHGASQFIAAGLCGGALTGLLAAERDARITELVALSIPVILDGANVDASRFMTAAELKGTRTAYLEKLKPGNWRSWLRLLTFQSDYRTLLRALGRPLLARLRPAEPAAEDPASPAVADNTNPFFAPAFVKMASTSRKMLLVFAETDRLYWEFEAKFLERHAAALAPLRNQYHVHVTARANHIFSFTEWQRDMLDECCRWLEEVRPAQPRREGAGGTEWPRRG
jgi:alpha/beta superfamily hydrolase